MQFGSDLKRAIENAEILRVGLEKRYLDRTNEMKIEKEMKELRIKNMKNDNFSNLNPNSKKENLQNGSLSTIHPNDNVNGGMLVLKFRFLSF